MRKSVIRTKRLPEGLSRYEIAEAWTLLNESLNPVGEYAIWEWHRNPLHGIFLIMPVGYRPKNFRYRMLVRAAKL